MSRAVHLKLKTPGLCALHSGGMGGVGWGGAITLMSRPVHLKLTTPGLYVSSGSITFMPRPVHLKLKTPVEDSWTLCSAFRGDGWGGVVQ